MIKVYDRLYVGAEDSCIPGTDTLAVVHACKSPCHQTRVGYRGSLDRNHPSYLAVQDSHDLFLNIIDPPIPLFMAETFVTYLTFADSRWKRGEQILIHCNQGESRAPSLAMLLMAKRFGVLSGSTFDTAAAEFQAIYPAYNPGQGIQTWLRKNWDTI